MSELVKDTTMNQTAEAENKKVKKPKGPKGWIRWSGVIALLVVAAILSAIVYLVASFALKSKIENLASEAWGAKVEIRSLGFGISPLGLKLDGLAITDTENPMENLVEISKIRTTINLYHLVHKRYVFEDVAVNGLKFHQPRKTSGAIVKRELTPAEKAAKEDSIFNLPSVGMPSTDDILERETLETVTLAEKINQDIKNIKDEWETLQKNLPTEADIKQYQKDLEDLFSTKISSLEDLKDKQAKFKELEKRWKKDQETLKQAKEFLANNSKSLKQDIVSLKDMPKKDLERLISTYSFDQSGLENVAYLLFGPEIQERVQIAMDWYRKAQPLLEWLDEYKKQKAEKERLAALEPQKFKGEWIKFPEYDPQPQFMVKRLSFDGELEWGDVQVKVWDLNFDHKESKKPIRTALMLKPQSQEQGLMAEGTISSVETEDIITKAQFSWQDYKVEQWDMLKASDLAIKLDEAKAQVNSDILLTNISKLDASLNIDYQQAAFNLDRSKSDQVKRYLAPVFKGINSFKVNAGLKGNVLAPKIDVSSDLDSKLAKGFKQALTQELQAFKKDLEVQLQAKLQESLKPLEVEATKLGLDISQLTSTENILDALSGKGNNQLDSAKKQLEDAAKDKLKKEASKHTDKLKQEAGDKIKKLLPF